MLAGRMEDIYNGLYLADGSLGFAVDAAQPGQFMGYLMPFSVSLRAFWLEERAGFIRVGAFYWCRHIKITPTKERAVSSLPNGIALST